MRQRTARAESFLPAPPQEEGAGFGAPVSAGERKIPKNFPFDPKALQPLARTVWASSVALGHALTAYRNFNRVKSSSVSPDGLLGGRGYVLKVTDLRTRLFRACEELSSVIDTLHDEINAPHWQPKLADLDANSAEDILHLLDEADSTMKDPEEEADEKIDDLESENDGPGGTSTKERFGDKETPGSDLPKGGNADELTKTPGSSRNKLASWDYQPATNPKDTWTNIPGGPRVPSLDRNLIENSPGGSANVGEPSSERNRERTREETDENKGIKFYAAVAYSVLPDGSLEPQNTVDDFGLGYGAKGPNYNPPQSDGKGITGPTSGLPAGPPASKVSPWDSDSTLVTERQVNDTTRHGQSKLPQPPLNVSPVARSDYYEDKGLQPLTAESTLPQPQDAMTPTDTDLPGASAMFDPRDTGYRRWDVIPVVKPDPLTSRKLPMGDLGNLADFFEETAGPVDHEWLAVDPSEYGASEALPQQNLDMVPDLKALWSHADRDPSVYAVPNRGMLENFGDASLRHAEPPASLTKEAMTRAARQILLVNQEPAAFFDALRRNHDLSTLRAHKGVLASVLAERGLLGPFYLDSLDFPGCNKREGVALAHQWYASTPYVLAKPDCGGCVFASKELGKDHCSVFAKTLVATPPYTEAEALRVEGAQAARGVQASQASTPKERIRLALLASPVVSQALPETKPVENTSRTLTPVKPAPAVTVAEDLALPKAAALVVLTTQVQSGKVAFDQAAQWHARIREASTSATLSGVVTDLTQATPLAKRVYEANPQAPVAPLPSMPEVQQALVTAANLTKKRDAAFNLKVAQEKAKPVLALLRREMLKGRKPGQLEQALRASFDVTDLASTKPFWAPLVKEAGLYGEVYLPQEAFADCLRGADIVASYQPTLKVIVSGQKCAGCVHNRVGYCNVYRRPLVAGKEAAFTPTVARSVFDDKLTRGTLPASSWSRYASLTPRDAVQAMYREEQAQQARRADDLYTAFAGASQEYSTSDLTKRDVVKTARLQLNEGLYGDDLLSALRLRFDERDLRASLPLLRPVLAEQGLQGIYYVDPTVYDDYGTGCDTASSLHRTRGAIKYAKVGPACFGCLFQTRPGVCSKLAKTLVQNPPYTDKTAQQKAILASGRSTETDYASLLNNGANVVAEYHLRSQGDIELDPENPNPAPIGVQLGGNVI